jgi:hypothetical protein
MAAGWRNGRNHAPRKAGSGQIKSSQRLERALEDRRVSVRAPPERAEGRRELEQIEVVVQHAGAERLKPIYDALHGLE